MTTKKSFLLRIDEEVYKALAGWAEQELRSVNGQIEYVLKEAVKKRKESRPSPSEEASNETK